MKNFKKKDLYYIITGIVVCIALILVDQLTKFAAVRELSDGSELKIIGNIFVLHYIENHGAAFGILQDQRIFFIIITVLIVCAMVYIYTLIPFTRRFRPLHIVLVFLSAGALGNLTDRIFRNGAVRDFLYFKLINFPVFNVADVYVTVSCVLLFFLLIFYYKEEDFDIIFQSKKHKKKDRN